MNCVHKNSCNCNSAAERELANQPVPWNVPTLFQSLSLEWLPTLFFHLKLLISSGLSVRGEWKLYNWEILFFVCLFYSLIYTISLRILSQGVKASALLLLKYLSHPGIVSRDWHLPDIRRCGNHLVAVQGADSCYYYGNLRGDLEAALCTVTETSG